MTGSQRSAGIVILGASHAGVATAAELRSGGYDGPLTLLGNEDGLPYHRPHLSKDALADGAAPGPLRPAAFYDDRDIRRRREHVEAIDRPTRRLILSGGAALNYDRLVLATGAAARALPDETDPSGRALLLRDHDDWRRLMTAWPQVSRLVVIGGGLIGLEVAQAARMQGRNVTVLEAADRLMARSLYPQLSQEVLNRHLADGIDIRLSAKAALITDDAIHLTDGQEVAASVVLASIGSTARDGLARVAGLPCNDGVLVDGEGRTTDPDIFALGDCARWPSGPDHVRHESVAATQWQARCVAAALTGAGAPAAVPLRLWSTQGAMRIQMAGPVRHDAHIHLQECPQAGLLLRAFAEGRLVAVQALDAARPFSSEVARLGAAETEFKDLLTASSAM